MKTLEAGIILFLVIILSLTGGTLGAYCQLVQSSGGQARWDNPPSSICSNCYCKWTGYKYCYGGCNLQEMRYMIQETSKDPFSRPSMDELYFCSAKNPPTKVQQHVTCYNSATNQPIPGKIDVTINVKEPGFGDCQCEKLGTASYPLSDSNKDDIRDEVRSYFTGETENVITKDH